MTETIRRHGKRPSPSPLVLGEVAVRRLMSRLGDVLLDALDLRILLSPQEQIEGNDIRQISIRHTLKLS